MHERGFGVGFMAGGSAREVAALEALPIDSLWIGGHVASRNPSPEATIGLARLAVLTERVTVGTAILLLPLYSPAIVAKQMADLDRVTDGRIVLGVGIGGEYAQEFRATQVPIKERGRRTDEAIPLIRALWSGEPVTHTGRYYPVEDVRLSPTPVQPGGPPIVVAGRQEPAMRRAARVGDGWMPYLYSPERYARSVATIRAEAADAGRDLDGFGWYAFVFTNVDPDGEVAREGAAAAVGGTYDQDMRAMVDRVTAAGTPAEVTATLQRFLDAGVDHFVFCPMGQDHGLIRTRLLEEVLPALQVPRP
jgi:probable F420-dependent oxidoreductase